MAGVVWQKIGDTLMEYDDKFHCIFYAASLNAWSINVSFSNGHQTRDQHISNNVKCKTISLRSPPRNPRFTARIQLILSRLAYWPYIRCEKDEIHINAQMYISLHDFLFICTIWFCQHITHWQTLTGRICRRKKQNRCKNKFKRKGTNKREQNKHTTTTAAAAAAAAKQHCVKGEQCYNRKLRWKIIVQQSERFIGSISLAFVSKFLEFINVVVYSFSMMFKIDCFLSFSAFSFCSILLCSNVLAAYDASNSLFFFAFRFSFSSVDISIFVSQ